MEYITATAKISSPSSDITWSGCHSENGLLVMLEVNTPPQLIASHAGKEILNSVITRFEEVKVAGTNNLLPLLNVVGGNKNITAAVIGLLKGDKLYIGAIGTGEAYLQRGGKIGRIVRLQRISEGVVKPGDVIIAHSQNFAKFVDEVTKGKILSLSDVDAMEEFIAGILVNQNEAIGISALILSIKQPQESISAIHKSDSLTKKNLGAGIQNWLKNIPKKILSGDADLETITRKKRLLAVTVLLIGALIISVIFSFKNSSENKSKKVLQEKLSLIETQYDEAVSLIDLNPIRARELLAASKINLTPLLKAFPKNSAEFKQVNEWFNKLSQSEVAAYKIYKLTAVPLYFDITLIKPEGTGSKISAYKEVKIILDTANKLVYFLSTDSKQATIIAGSETVKDAKTISVHGKTAYLVNEDGVIAIDIPSKSSRVAIAPDVEWGDIDSLASFAGNLYLLDSNKNAIWKYVTTDFGFSKKQNYLNSGVVPDFSSADNLIVDGSVWITAQNEVLKYNRGLSEQFAFKGFSDSVQSADSISTSDVDKYIYVLEKSLARILIFDKDGMYQAQYQWDELKNADKIVASEEEKKIFILEGSKIYAIDIK